MRRQVSKAIKKGRALDKKALEQLTAARGRFARNVADLARDEKRKPPVQPPRPFQLMERALNAELRLAQAERDYFETK